MSILRINSSSTNGSFKAEDVCPGFKNDLESAFFFIVIFVIYLVNCPETLTGLDAGELTAAGYELGIAHPPGFPIFSILCHGFFDFLPMGSLAFRGNIASSCLAALTFTLIFRSHPDLGGHRKLLWTFGLLAAITPLYCFHALTVEVYSGAGLFVVMLVISLVRYLDSQDLRWLWTLSVLIGLGSFGHHPLLRLVSLVLMPFVIFSTRIRYQLIAGMIVISSGLGATMFLYLRAQKNLWRDWGSPHNLPNLIDHILGTRIRQAYAEQMGAFNDEIARDFLEQLLWSHGAIVALGALAACFTIGRRRTQIWLILLMLEIGYGIFINPMGIRDYQVGWLSVICAFALIVEFSNIFVGPRKRIKKLLIGCGVILLVLGVLKSPFEDANSSSHWREAVKRTFTQLPPETLVFTASDGASATAAYLQVVEGARPDVAVMVRQHLYRSSSTGPTARRLPRSMSWWQPGANLNSLQHIPPSWPIAWEYANGLDREYMPSNLSYHVPFFTGNDVSVDGTIALLERGFDVSKMNQNKAFRRQMLRAGADLANDQGKSAADRYRKLSKGALVDPFTSHRLSILLTLEKRYAEAQRFLLEALQKHPADDLLWEQLTRVYLSLSKPAEALAIIEQWAPSTRRSQSTRLGLSAVAHGNLKRIENALRDCTRALELDSKQEEARVVCDALDASKSVKSAH